MDTSVHNIVYSTEDPSNQYIRLHTSSYYNAGIFIIIHGGFWKAMYSLDNSLIDTLYPFLSKEGYNVALLEYRRVEHINGGWPGTNEDILKGIQKLYSYSNENNLSIDFNKAIILGHSAGGTLALWTCCNPTCSALPFTPLLCVACAPIGDLEYGYTMKLSDSGDAIYNYMHGAPTCTSTDLEKDSYRLASPHHLLPLQVDTILVSGDQDDCVPAYIVNAFYQQILHYQDQYQEKTYKMVQYIAFQNTDHFQMVNSTESAWLKLWEQIQLKLSPNRLFGT